MIEVIIDKKDYRVSNGYNIWAKDVIGVQAVKLLFGVVGCANVMAMRLVRFVFFRSPRM